MENYSQPGEILELTAPSGGVVSGLPYKIGGLVVIATVTAAQGTKFSAIVTGCVTVPRATGGSSAWTEGAPIYWDDSADNFTKSVISDTGDMLVGVAAAATADGDATGIVRLDGVTR
jgi:predicted RecA/RadA family phage recombinase